MAKQTARVLLLTRDAPTRGACRSVIESLGFDAVEAQGCVAALEAAGEGNLRLVIFDWAAVPSPPDSFLEDLNAAAEEGTLQVVATCPRDRLGEVAEHAKRLELRLVLPKPINEGVLRQAVAGAVAMSQKAAERAAEAEAEAKAATDAEPEAEAKEEAEPEEEEEAEPEEEEEAEPEEEPEAEPEEEPEAEPEEEEEAEPEEEEEPEPEVEPEEEEEPEPEPEAEPEEEEEAEPEEEEEAEPEEEEEPEPEVEPEEEEEPEPEPEAEPEEEEEAEAEQEQDAEDASPAPDEDEAAAEDDISVDVDVETDGASAEDEGQAVDGVDADGESLDQESGDWALDIDSLVQRKKTHAPAGDQATGLEIDTDDLGVEVDLDEEPSDDGADEPELDTDDLGVEVDLDEEPSDDGEATGLEIDTDDLGIELDLDEEPSDDGADELEIDAQDLGVEVDVEEPSPEAEAAGEAEAEAEPAREGDDEEADAAAGPAPEVVNLGVGAIVVESVQHGMDDGVIEAEHPDAIDGDRDWARQEEPEPAEAAQALDGGPQPDQVQPEPAPERPKPQPGDGPAGVPSFGSLGGVTFAELFLRCFHGKHSGSLTVEQEDRRRSFHFSSGQPVGFSCGNPADGLIPFLYENNKIDGDRGSVALDQVVRTGADESQVLIEHSLVDPQQLVAAMEEHLVEMCTDCFGWTDGIFIFENWPPGSTPPRLTGISAPDMVVAGLVRNPVVEPLEALVRLPDAAVLRRSKRPLLEQDKLHVGPRAARAMDLALTGWSVAEVAGRAGKNPWEARAVMRALCLLGIAEVPEGGPRFALQQSGSPESVQEALKEYFQSP